MNLFANEPMPIQITPIDDAVFERVDSIKLCLVLPAITVFEKKGLPG